MDMGMEAMTRGTDEHGLKCVDSAVVKLDSSLGCGSPLTPQNLVNT